MPDHCAVCEKPKQIDSEFCSLHNAAHKGLEATYPKWKKSYGNLTKAQYYCSLEKLNETGAAVKDVIRHFREKEATQ